MYEILKNYIENGTWKVSEIQERIDTFYAENKITLDQKQELEQLVFDNKDPDTEIDTLQELYKKIAIRVDDIEKRVDKLEGTEEPGTEPGTVPEWKPYDAVTNTGYDYGAVVHHNEKYWQNMLQGMKNTWEPGSAGVDERYWKEISKEEAEEIISGLEG